MTRRALFAALFAPFVARFAPKPTPAFTVKNVTKALTMDEISKRYIIPALIAQHEQYLQALDDLCKRRYPCTIRGDTIIVKRPERYGGGYRS